MENHYSGWSTSCDNMIVARMHRREGEAVLAACDKELIGRTLTDGKLKVSITEGFYGSQVMSGDDLLLLMGQATAMNLFGEKTVKLASDAGYAEEESVMLIDGVPHIQIYFF